MPTSHTLTGDLSDLVGTGFPRDSVWVTIRTNLGDDADVRDSTGKQLRLPYHRFALSADGTFSKDLWSTAALTNPTAYQYQVEVEYPTGRGGTARQRWISGWFSHTADQDLSELAYDPLVPPVYYPELLGARDEAVAAKTDAEAAQAAAEAAQAAAEAVGDTNDTIMAGVASDSGSAFSSVLSASFAPRPRLTLITPNDSISRQNLYESGITKGWAASGYLTWLNAWLGQRVEIVNPRNAPVPGNTTADVLARLDTDVTPYAAGVAVVLLGTNDIAAGTASATIIANLETIYDRLRAAGSTVIACTILPRNRSDDSDAKRTALREVNTWIRSYCQTTRGAILADTHARLVNPSTGRALGNPSVASQWFADGIHPNPDGAHAIASELYRVLDPLLPRYNNLTSSNADETNLISNGRFYNQGGFLSLSGTSGRYASLPDFAAIPRGTFSIAVWAALDDWTPSGPQALLAQNLSTGDQRSFHFRINAGGLPQLSLNRYGDTSVAGSYPGASAPAFTDGQVGCIVVTRDTTAQTVQYATSAVAASASVANLAALSKSNLGAAVSGTGNWDTFDSSAAVEIGSREGGTVDMLAGKVYRVMMFDASGATVLDANFTGYDGENTYPTVVSGQTVTIHPAGKSVADGWTLSNGSGNTATATKVARTDIPGEWQQVQVTANTGSGITTDLSIPVTGWTVGDIIECEVEVEVDGNWTAGSGGAQALSPFVRLKGVNGSAADTFISQSPVFLGNPTSLKPLVPAGYSAPFRSVLKVPATTIPAGTATITLQLRHGAGATGTARWDRCRVRKVAAAV